jgi:hypothetical protein
VTIDEAKDAAALISFSLLFLSLFLSIYNAFGMNMV